ncbi:MAG TPA: DegQ family serine endoprotease [Usitatibacter sp.]|nr:DegQ family serine endoprotease [Usitatibacter sp.]
MKRLQPLFLGAFLALATGIAQAQATPPARNANPHNTPSTPGATAQVLPDFADLVDKYGPAVVNINTETRMPRQQAIPGLSEDDPFYEFFKRFMPPEQRQQQPGKGDKAPKGPLRPFGLGSGFIVSSDGYIVTNAHVVENADEVKVRLTDKRELKAKVIGVDLRSDVAVVKVDATNLPTVKIGDSSKLRTGEWVIAIGSPYGFANSVTAGIVSATSRDNLSTDPNMDAVPFIQTDVAVNPGNSGGPLLNMHGEVVGINSQIFSRTGAFAGISFAIPIDYAYGVAEQLMKTGHVTRGRIGVGITNVTRDLADSLGLPKPQGAAVLNVEDGSPAAKAGLEPGDVILKIDGHAVDGSSDLSRTIRGLKPGTNVHLTVFHNGKTRDATMKVGEFKDTDETKESSSQPSTPQAAKPGKLGLAVSDIPADQKKALKLPGGVAVEAVEGAAQNAGIQPGDVILRVNNTDIANVKAFNDAIAKLDPKKPVALLVRNEQGTRFAIIRSENE